MINRTYIRTLANSASYTKGMDLYRQDKVMGYSVEEGEDGCDYIEAVVKGSGRNRYQVSLQYDREEEQLEDVNCECPAFFSYSGICKHCVAVLLEYADDVARHKAIEEYAQKQERSLEKLQELKGARALFEKARQAAQPKTTPAIKELLSRRQLKRGLPVLQEETYGKVRLEPFLNCNFNGDISVEFKIGHSRMYVLQDIFAFVRNVDDRKDVEYGAKLKFVHDIEMFDGESKPLVHFMCGWVLENGRRYLYNTYYNGYSVQALRKMPLTAGELERFLDAVGDREFLGTVGGMEERWWKRSHDVLPRTMKITGTEDGAELEINRLNGFQGLSSYFYFDDGKIYVVPKAAMEPIADFITAMAEVSQRKVFIQKEDLPVFCRELLPELERHFVCTEEHFREEDYQSKPVTFEIYLDALQRDTITCKPIAVYGERKYDVYGKADDSPERDLVREMEVGKVVSSYCNAYDDIERMMVAAQDEEVLYELLVEGIAQFQKLGEVFISDALKKIRITKAPKAAVGVSLSGDLLELSMTAGEMPREQLLEILSKYNRKKKFYRLKNGDFVNMEDEDFQALLELKEGLGLTDGQLKQETVALPKYRALYLEEKLKEQHGLASSKNQGFKALVRNMKSVEEQDFKIPDSLGDILREYQKYGFFWIKTLKQNGFGGILADDMGLGKTLQVITFLVSEFQEAKKGENRRTLIVSPASLVFNWNSELQKFAPDLPVQMVVGTAEERRAIIQYAGEREILLTSYDLLKRDIAYYEGKVFFCQVVDEAQYIKNHNTQAAKAVKMVQAGFKLALTGTPVENRLSELWSIFDYLMPGFLYSYQRFKGELEQPIVQNQDEAARIRLQKMIRPFVLRRLKRDVLKDLPDKLEKCVYARMEGEQQKLYDAHVKRM